MSDVGLWAQLACVWEATAKKPGNVHRGRDFAGLTYLDFLHSAAAIGPAMTMACHRPVGETILECVRATRRVVSTNTNLGIVLLLAPLATVPPGKELRAGVARVLANLTVEDARLTYEAIRLAVPGGMGEVPEQDVRDEPTRTLREVMALAADRDTIARQYVTDFEDVWEIGLPRPNPPGPPSLKGRGEEDTNSFSPLPFREGGPGGLGQGLERAIQHTALRWMAERPDSLVARKHGPDVARLVAERARAVLSNSMTLDDFDASLWQRRWNPGTTADLVTATLFVALREGRLLLPLAVSW